MSKMETVANFFGGNPFATPIGQKIGELLLYLEIKKSDVSLTR